MVALAEPGGTGLTSDLADLHSLAAHASDVLIERIRGSVRERSQWTASRQPGYTLSAVNSPPLVRCAGVGYATAGSVVLDGVDLTINARDVIGVSGPNGAGKTTLLRLLATLHRPSSGSCTVLGVDAGARSGDLVPVRREIALIGHFPAIWPELTLRENVDLPAGLRPYPAGGDPLHAVGLAGVAGLKAAHASLGMQRRVEFARLLSWTPRLLLLDEPHAGLDEATGPLVDHLVSRVTDRDGAVVMVSHDRIRAGSLLTRRMSVTAGTVREAP
ncbi:ABC transporter ATP-binding protein [Candidatus Spongiisocius sp.]|uniref:ABC transporter ATP-binding protein n=1 Tax=Candidatus Spongiisocius sp. TaxID=3101273 RepID=UPI003B5A1AD4